MTDQVTGDGQGAGADAPNALVVGAGVSGCACAVALAGSGIQVTLINSAMDRVGLPAYGPDLVASEMGRGELEQKLATLPEPLRSIWLEAGMAPEDGGSSINVDRRRISVETKRLLEAVPNLRFRQGFVTDLRLVQDGDAGHQPLHAQHPRRAQVETIFGEVFEADAVILAAGLSLDAQTEVGCDVVQGGRYGEPASEGLYRALDGLGACFQTVELEVGARALERDFDALAEAIGARIANSGSLETRHLSGLASGSPTTAWPEGFPPAPHLDHPRLAMVLESSAASELAGEGPVISPDGSATREVYLDPGVPVGVVEDASVLTRMPVRVTAKTVAGLDGGRFGTAGGPTAVWVVGRAGGARTYLESLTSGVEVAGAVAAALRDRGCGA